MEPKTVEQLQKEAALKAGQPIYSTIPEGNTAQPGTDPPPVSYPQPPQPGADPIPVFTKPVPPYIKPVPKDYVLHDGPLTVADFVDAVEKRALKKGMTVSATDASNDSRERKALAIISMM